MSWVRVPPEAAHFSRKKDCLGCAVLLCLVCLFDLASFFHLSFKNMYVHNVHVCTQWCMFMHIMYMYLYVYNLRMYTRLLVNYLHVCV